LEDCQNFPEANAAAAVRIGYGMRGAQCGV
jgi:hypothetical protein